MTGEVVESEHLKMWYLREAAVWQVGVKTGYGAVMSYFAETVEPLWRAICPGSTIVIMSETYIPTGNVFGIDFGVGDALTSDQCKKFLDLLELDTESWQPSAILNAE